MSTNKVVKLIIFKSKYWCGVLQFLQKVKTRKEFNQFWIQKPKCLSKCFFIYRCKRSNPFKRRKNASTAKNISAIDLDGLIADLEAEVVVGGVPDAWENVEDVREFDKLTELGEDPGLEIGEN